MRRSAPPPLAYETDEVHFLIEHHLDMSETMQRRDISIQELFPFSRHCDNAGTPPAALLDDVWPTSTP